MSEYRFVKSLLNTNTNNKKQSAKTQRTTAYGADWSILSSSCLRIANNICRDCGSKASYAHHIIPLSRGGTNSLINLKAVCGSCHKKYHKHLR
jgi:5-methylcytosine-specific restriction endonuclease McrA